VKLLAYYIICIKTYPYLRGGKCNDIFKKFKRRPINFTKRKRKLCSAFLIEPGTTQFVPYNNDFGDLALSQRIAPETMFFLE
jgi:hypothetical protein